MMPKSEGDTSLLPYFPFQDDTFKMSMGVRSLEHGRLIEIDHACYQSDVALKRTLLTETHTDYFQALPETEPLQWEVLELLLPNMALHYPQYFTLTREGDRWTWRNELFAEETLFVLGHTASLPLAPLDWLGRQVQEDLLILSGTREGGIPLVAGQLCFPNAWCLDDKMAQPFLDIHQTVPFFAQQLGHSSTLLLERLKAGRSVWRVNWAIRATDRLNLIPGFLHEERQVYPEITCGNIGDRCFLRIELQILTRLPRTGGVLFTIHTYQAPLASVIVNADAARRMLQVVKTMPEEVVCYKSLAPFVEALTHYLLMAI